MPTGEGLLVRGDDMKKLFVLEAGTHKCLVTINNVRKCPLKNRFRKFFWMPFGEGEEFDEMMKSLKEGDQIVIGLKSRGRLSHRQILGG